MTSKKWITSKEAIKLAKIKSCDLMHYRLEGKLQFKKKGNAYYYSKESVTSLKK
ncbi:MerR family transcriptional regulator [Tenacibaculum sp. 47A_GOM-205m]|uniref:MerR family transcriptional regulator n=1 Tax=Tenacibaculum sp. 47A_GOM-205m TaxID=1380384 RepID=UPI0004BB3C24|nr:MerR family transcriptional regulator [Tenacibaculum sp. 47A_GOM-205m]